MIKWPKQITVNLVEQLIKAEKDLQKAILIFDAASGEYNNGFRHDHSTFGLMISRFVSANQFRAAEDMLDRMKDEKCNITEDIFLSICRGYGRVHKPLEAITVFQRMKEYECEPTLKSYITVFSILADENQLKLALKFYRYMRELGIPPSVTSLNVLIKALCKNSGTMDAALRIFREMPIRGCIPDAYTYGTLINGLCRFDKIGVAKELFMEMSDKGCSPTVVTYTSLIHGLCRSNNMDEAMGLLEEMKSKEGKLRESLEILDRMKLQGLKPDAGLYCKIINGFCDVHNFQKAANFLDEMVLEGISPNRVTWSLHVRIHNTVVQGLLTESDPNRAFQLYLSMRTRGLSVEARTFDSLVNCFCKKRDLHKAARIFEEMVVDGCLPDEGTWTVVVSGFWDRKKAWEAAELVQVKLIGDVFEAAI
ncbi:hypothetical protein Vadar_004881 [Vaccinium darrowii]|uniref:Uncharacterized protein n=1 Tax=Vaccinium darrowii TaxID=229202 RepID=A0ACB7X889_9ERIC|nr:hypothetical protein Vadar_004881 [Vaccinium darrowii]